MSIATMTAGLLLRRQVRGYLQEKKFRGEVADFTEVKGFLESDFLIRDAQPKVLRALEHWSRAINKDHAA
jgi:hypothetical protein